MAVKVSKIRKVGKAAMVWAPEIILGGFFPNFFSNVVGGDLKMRWQGGLIRNIVILNNSRFGTLMEMAKLVNFVRTHFVILRRSQKR